MTEPSAAEGSEQFARLQRLGLGIDAYILTVRQGPERAKVFAGLKEKDRKPVDPPPIIQLQIRDPADPAQNYLQSPYFFMCCNLCDADIDRPGQLAAARLGEDIYNASQSALAGTVVSSLHRLKDTNNSDGGFFVFPDVSVKIEGSFRLRFSLFEMLKGTPKVVFIKSITSDSFTVYSSRAFPGMSESTFLSRSFGDQGVKIRIRKEPRTLGKRSAPSDYSEQSWSQPQQSNVDSEAALVKAQLERSEDVRPSKIGDSSFGYEESPSKRQRTSVDSIERSAYDEIQRSSQPSYSLQRNPYAQFSSPEESRTVRSPQYSQFSQGFSPLAAPSGDFVQDHRRRDSSSSVVTYRSSGTDWAPPNTPSSQMFQQAPRDYSQQYPFYPSTSSQSRPFTQPLQPVLQNVPPDPRLPSSASSYTSSVGSVLRSVPSQERLGSFPSSTEGVQGRRPSYAESHIHPSTQQSLTQAPARTLPFPSQPIPSVLPPLGSNMSTNRGFPNRNFSSGETGSAMSSYGGPGSLNQGQASANYQNRNNG